MQILYTKLSIPLARARSVSRLRLIQKLNQGLECNFTLVSAPAGYGKSTLLSSWLDQLEMPSVWLSLDDNDNDFHRFISYLCAAFHQVDPVVTTNVDAPSRLDSQPDVETTLTQIINQLAEIKSPFCLVLDDYHVIHDQHIHQAVTFLLEHHPESLHLVISTRADPPLPLARLRARCEMLELRMADLRFTNPEAADFLKYTMELKISPEDAARITQRTEGWIAGLQMAALSMQNAKDLSRFIDAFTGSHHYIFDYLLEEILDRQPPEIQRFLLFTSVLDQLSAPLCDALLVDGKSEPPISSQGILADLEHSNLFIIPLDHEQCWYRYHPLFAELLRGYLQKKEPSQVLILHTRASTWYEQQGMISDAIRHSFAISDWERSVRLISGNIFALLEQNELTSVARQLENLIGKNSLARPWLLIAHAWLQAYTGQLSAVEPILKQAEKEIDSMKSEEELQTLGGHIAAIRAYINWIGDNRELAANAAQVALEWLPPTERLIRCQASTLLGLTLPDFNQRTQALAQALAYARECRVSHVTIFAHGCWAWLLAMLGKLHDSYAACQDAIRLAQAAGSYGSLPTLSHVYATISAVTREWNDLESALYYGKEAVDLARRWEQADALHFALDNYGYALFASGDVEAAFATLRQTWQVARRTSAWFEQITLSQEIEWYLILNNLDAAVDCFHRAGLDLDDPQSISLNSFKTDLLPLSFVQVYLAQEQYSNALKLISSISEDPQKNQVGYYNLRLSLWQALAYHGLKQEESAMRSFKRLLLMAEPEGYLRIFINAGAAVLPLLHKALLDDITPDYTARLIGELEQIHPLQPVRPRTAGILIEPLSNREMEVLQLLSQGCSDKKIAEALVIAPETVHKHLKNIYGKLAVHNRTEAVSRALQLALL